MTGAAAYVRALHVIALVVALLAGSTQCLLRCAGTPCHDESVSSVNSTAKLPPCHQHRKKEPAPAQPCKFPLLVAEDQAPAIHKAELTPAGIAFAAASTPAPFLLDLGSGDLLASRETSPPPLAQLVFSTVLRI